MTVLESMQPPFLRGAPRPPENLVNINGTWMTESAARAYRATYPAVVGPKLPKEIEP